MCERERETKRERERERERERDAVTRCAISGNACGQSQRVDTTFWEDEVTKL
jgi:hypothetical protein